MKLTPYAVVANITDHHWGQVIILPNAYGVVEMYDPSGNARTVGITIINTLTTLCTRFKSPKDIVTAISRLSLPEELESMIFIFPEGEWNRVFVLVKKSGICIMQRGKFVATLLKKDGVLFGDIQAGDSLLLLTKRAGVLGSERLQEILSEPLRAKQLAETFTIWLQHHEEASGCAGMVIAVEDTDPKPILFPVSRVVFAPPRIHIKTILNYASEHRFLVIALVFGLFFTLSVLLGIRKQATDASQKTRAEAIESAAKLFEEGVSLMDAQPAKSRTVLSQAQERLSPYLLNPPKTKERKVIEELSQKIKDNIAIVSRVFKREGKLLFDASYIEKDRVISAFSLGVNFFALLDRENGMVAALTLDGKNADVVGGGEKFVGSSGIDILGNTIYVVTKEGIIAIRQGQKEGKLVVPRENEWGENMSFTAYGGNMYIASRTNAKVYRYVNENGVFGPRQEYFAQDISPDISQTTNIAIDGSVWFGSSVGKIFRYTQGKEDPFIVRGVEPSLGQLLFVAVPPEGDYLYILDREQKRVVVVRKDGVYKAQYVWDQDILPDFIAVSEARKEIYLLAGQKLYVLKVE